MTGTPITCEQALRLIAEHLDGELEGAASAEVAAHLERCRSCWSRAEFERRLKAELGALGRVPMRRALEERLQRLAADFRAP